MPVGEESAQRRPHVVKRTLVARSGNRFKLDRALRENFWLAGDATASTLFPLLSGENVADIAIENLTLDGNRANNDNLDGNYAGCIFLQDCNAVAIRSVTARNYNGDGISWQICHDVVVENCHSHDHAGLGLHPGSGSQRPVMRNNTLARNAIGIFFCWGVRYGLAEGNTIEDSSQFGISIGHRDTDNLIRDNTIRRSGQAGDPVPPRAGPGLRPPPQPRRKTTASKTAAQTTAWPSTSKARARASRWPATRWSKPAPSPPRRHPHRQGRAKHHARGQPLRGIFATGARPAEVRRPPLACSVTPPRRGVIAAAQSLPSANPSPPAAFAYSIPLAEPPF